MALERLFYELGTMAGSQRHQLAAQAALRIESVHEALAIWLTVCEQAASTSEPQAFDVVFARDLKA